MLLDFIQQTIPHDKLLHFWVSFVLMVVIFLIRKYYLKNSWFIRIFAYSFRDVLIIWLFKEIIDAFWYWNPEFLDFVADASWVIIPVYIFSLIKLSSQLKTSRKLIFEKKLIFDFKKEKKTLIKIKIFLFLSLVWFLNIIYLFLKIPLLAMKETFCLVKKWIQLLRD